VWWREQRCLGGFRLAENAGHVVQVLKVFVAKNRDQGRGRHRADEAAVGTANTQDRHSGPDRRTGRLLAVCARRDDVGVRGTGKLSDWSRSVSGHHIANLSHPDEPAILV
jgi:hypothetical protein